MTTTADRFLLIASLAWALFISLAPAAEIAVPLQERREWHFEDAGVTFSNNFPGARVNALEQTGAAAFSILIQPENVPINNSAWYAFEVTAAETKSIAVTLTYENGRPRYHPQISLDGGLTWSPLSGESWRHNREANETVLELTVGSQPIRIAGQEMIGEAELRGWMEAMAQRASVRQAPVGTSILGKRIDRLEIGNPESGNYVFIMGRQHPPELTGTLGLIDFVEELAGDSPLARAYREQFQTIVIPLMNPDGVEHGHWRSNMAGVDLNRDWGEFAQPETRAVRDLLERLAAEPGAKIFLLLDFHSTHRDIFYTQEDEHPTFPENFTANWLGAIQERMPDYAVRRSASYLPRAAMFMNWGYKTFGAPAITYELGDHTDRDLIRGLAAVSCQEMMRILLSSQ